MKRVRFTESRGQKRQSEDVEELAARAEEKHLDADVEVPAHKTWRIEDVVGDAADAAPEQMNSFVQSKKEVFEKIEESLRPLCMVEDLNDDEIMDVNITPQMTCFRGAKVCTKWLQGKVTINSYSLTTNWNKEKVTR